jgi:hypothetical protein
VPPTLPFSHRGATSDGRHVLVDSAFDDSGMRIDATVGALSISPVPEPTTPALMLAGLAGLALIARRRA